MAQDARAHIIPSLRYANAPAAIDWLCEAFGFERQLVVPAADGGIEHAQLTYRNGMIMLGSDRDDDFRKLQATPAEVGGRGTQSPYVVVPDADAHWKRAKAAGARIVADLVDQAHGGRGYSCLDPEDHLWHFGTYDPYEVA